MEVAVKNTLAIHGALANGCVFDGKTVRKMHQNVTASDAAEHLHLKDKCLCRGTKHNLPSQNYNL